MRRTARHTTDDRGCTIDADRHARDDDTHLVVLECGDIFEFERGPLNTYVTDIWQFAQPACGVD